MTYAEDFWYDGHHGRIEFVQRAKYTAYLNGEEFESSNSPSYLRDELLAEMKYRTEREPDFYNVCRGFLQFLDYHVPGRNDDNDWVLMDSVREEVILNDWGMCLEVMYGLIDAGYIEVTQAYDTPNSQYLLRPTVEELPESEELSERVPKLWVDNE